MTQVSEGSQQVMKVIVFFDICSSASILEDLLRTENRDRWRNLLIELKDYLRENRVEDGFEIYKFIGDGWVLLFDTEACTDAVFGFMIGLCNKYKNLYDSMIRNVLTVDIINIGITFGIDRGTLIKFVMNGSTEYVGRPLNVAARLQGAIKDRDSEPAGKVLISNNAFVYMSAALQGKYRIDNAKRSLRNIAGGTDYMCKKVWLFQKPLTLSRKARLT